MKIVIRDWCLTTKRPGLCYCMGMLGGCLAGNTYYDIHAMFGKGYIPVNVRRAMKRQGITR